MARLAAPNIPTIQVDWSRYGPKLAQVALTFGADDLDGVTAADEAPDGRRRAPLEEVRRNIEAAGFSPAERDGRFNQWSVDVMSPLCRLGAVGYLNARPLTWALDRAPERWQIRYDVPSVCSALLHAGEVDLGLVPSIDYLRGARLPVRAGRRHRIARAGRVGRALHARADRGRPADRARHQLANVGGARQGAVPSPVSHRAGIRAARPGPRGDDARIGRGAADRRPGARSRPVGARAPEDRSRARSGRR